MSQTLDPQKLLKDRFTDFVENTDYGNYAERLSDGSVDDYERSVLGSSGLPPNECIKVALDVLRSDFDLDYDDLLFGGEYLQRIPQAVARNVLLGHFISLGNGLTEASEHFSDATLNSAAEDYTSLADLITCRLEKVLEDSGYTAKEEDLPQIILCLDAIKMLTEFCWHMMDMSASLKPAEFKKKCFRLKSRLNSLVDMATFGNEHPDIEELRNEISSIIDRILADKRLDDLQRARNERYKQSKIWLYNFTIRSAEDLNNQLEACDPYDFTHRSDLKKQLEAVQRFMRSFDKDR